MKYMIVILALVATGASATELHYSQPSKDIFTDTFITGLSDSTVLFPWGNQICDTSEKIINTHGIGKSYDKRIKILPNTARNGSTALWVRSRDGAWIVIQSNNVDGGRTCIAARGSAGTKLPNITLGLPETDDPGYQAHAAGSAQEIKGTIWNIITTDSGCIAYLTGSYFNDQEKITWSGNCQNGKPISGKGNLTLWFNDGEKFFLSGQFVNGYLNGKLRGGGLNGPFNDNWKMGCRAADEPKCSSTRPTQVGRAKLR